VDSATIDVTLEMKRFPLLFSPCCPVTPKSAPVIFFRGISLETLMESAFVEDIVVIFDPFLRFSPVFCPVIFPGNSQWRRVRIRLHPQPRSPLSKGEQRDHAADQPPFRCLKHRRRRAIAIAGRRRS
jgi:hypothetical protein